MRSTLSLRSFPQHHLWNGSNVRLTDHGHLSSFQGRSSSTSSFHASLLLVIDDVMSLALCPQEVSQAPQHFKSSEKQATCEGCFACQSTWLSFPFTLACPGQYTQFSKMDVKFQSGLPIPFLFFVASSLTVRMMAWVVRSDCHLLRHSSRGHASTSTVRLEVKTI